jgi:hypothetical protein
MNDDFLYKSKPSLRSEFAEKLYAIISQKVGTKSGTNFHVRKNNALRIALRFAIILLFVFSITLIVSHDARALISNLFQEINGFLFEESDQFPFSDHPERDYQELPSFKLNQAQEMLPFSLTLPSNVPSEYEQSDKIGIACNTSCATLTWHNETNDTLMLLIQMEENYPEWAEPIGLESVEEVYVSGKAAVLIRGAWDFETEQWNEAKALRLKWEQEGLIYDLSWRLANSGENVENKLSVEELIQIAESIK